MKKKLFFITLLSLGMDSTVILGAAKVTKMEKSQENLALLLGKLTTIQEKANKIMAERAKTADEIVRLARDAKTIMKDYKPQRADRTKLVDEINAIQEKANKIMTEKDKTTEEIIHLARQSHATASRG